MKNKEFTLLSANCVGGVILHELGLRFDTPTINLFFRADDFVKFAGNLKYYLNCELTEEPSDRSYPVAKLDDLTLYLVHYESFSEAKRKWEERKKRIHWDNIFLIMGDRDGCTYETMKRFDELPYEHKALLTYRRVEGIRSAVLLSGCEQDGELRNLCNYQTKFTGKRWLDRFDYVAFLNGQAVASKSPGV